MSAEAICRTCGHPRSHHDAGGCWTLLDGRETFGETSCPCHWFEPLPPESDRVAAAIIEAWNTPPWSCNLDAVQQRIMARIAAHVVVDGLKAVAEPSP